MPAPSKSKWEKPTPDLIELFEQLTPRDPMVEKRKMFGFPCWFANGYLFAGLFEQCMFLRLSDRDLAAFLATEGVTQFSPMEGRPMKEYGAFAHPLEEDPKVLKKWIIRGFDHVASMPPKMKAAKKSPKKPSPKPTKKPNKTSPRDRKT